jgi:hypothetical protein
VESESGYKRKKEEIDEKKYCKVDVFGKKRLLCKTVRQE